MKKEKFVKALATGMLFAGLVTSLGGPVLADSNFTTEVTSATNIAPGKAVLYSITNGVAKQSTLKEALADLVTAGTITQDQSEVVFTYFQQNLPQKPVINITAPAEGVNKPEQGAVLKIVDPLKDLVDKGTITEEQAQSIRDKMRDIADQQMQQQWQTSLNTLVSKGTITEDQADRVIEFLEANKQEMQSMPERIKDMSQEERTQYLKENMSKIQDPVSQMIEQGIITQQQADAMKEAMPSLPKVVHIQKPSPQQLQANLDALVSNGTITEDQIDKILTFLEADKQEMKSIFGQIKDMGQEQKDQYFKENLGDIKEPVSQMVEQGIITQQQVDAVREAVTGAAGIVLKDELVGSGVPGGKTVFFSSAASDESRN